MYSLRHDSQPSSPHQSHLKKLQNQYQRLSGNTVATQPVSDAFYDNDPFTEPLIQGLKQCLKKKHQEIENIQDKTQNLISQVELIKIQENKNLEIQQKMRENQLSQYQKALYDNYCKQMEEAQRNHQEMCQRDKIDSEKRIWEKIKSLESQMKTKRKNDKSVKEQSYKENFENSRSGLDFSHLKADNMKKNTFGRTSSVKPIKVKSPTRSFIKKDSIFSSSSSEDEKQLDTNLETKIYFDKNLSVSDQKKKILTECYLNYRSVNQNERSKEKIKQKDRKKRQ